ncbi:hypothetical protein J4E93_008666 [Alternaria ventricosa]|uniref:uncharacterized protein n=1 Tax=Alternaria ventricosa TaxID=1187951 RepID=UPI0020C4B782|nr:uncharacterized protein J4E93_008666 [Alternaria ventricosa]KAI4640460.1 hypothetical protein J4E93_008666 [Alternaria ventricosa]
MDDQKLLPPLARGDSKRANLDKLSILDLPGETRNQIFGYLVEHKDPIQISCSCGPLGYKNPLWLRSCDCAPSQHIGALLLRLGKQVWIPLNLFASCRTLYREAVSAFYSGNTFAMEIRRYWSPHARASRVYDIELPIAFLTRIGSQMHWLRRVVLDLENLDYDTSRLPLLSPRRSGKELADVDGGPALFEITPLLRAIWKMGPTVDFSFHQKKRLPDQSMRGVCNAPGMSAMLRSILEGQLRLREQDRLLGAVSLYRDGSGGKISWGISNPNLDGWSFERGRVASDHYYTSTFIAEDGGARLEVSKREKPLALLDLPKPLCDYIFNMVVHPRESHRIDLGTHTKIDCGLINVNWEVHRSWRDQLLFHNSFELVLTTDRARTDFDQFNHLRRLLRKTFHTDGFDIPTRTVLAGPGVDNELKYILKFELQGAISLSDIRISILPLVMETSTASGEDGVTIQVWVTDTEGHSTLATSHTLTLQELRLNVIAVMMKTYYLESKALAPDIWINGFGEVVQVNNVDEPVGGAWEPASELVPIGNTEGGFVVWRLHPVDIHYRSDDILSQKAVLYDVAQFFPFRRKVSEILPYLIKIVDRAGPYEAVLGG